MHLISPLIAGVRGAESGYAKICRRGTTVLATLYSSFEGDNFGSASLDSQGRVILDAYGRAEVYVGEVCDVTVYDSSGTQQIVFTAGSTAAAIEVRSAAFTGRVYDYTESTGVGQPTNLAAVLAKWLEVRGAIDWGLTGTDQPFVVVTDPAYGATGDGTTDDTAAIGAAFAAAFEGGLVFFPPGVYRLTSGLAVPEAVSILGCGPSASAVRLDHASDALFSMGTAQNTTIAGLTLRAQNGHNNALMLFGAQAECAVSNCYFEGQAGTCVSTDVEVLLSFTNCQFFPKTSSAVDMSSGEATRARFVDCYFETQGSFASANGIILGNNIDITRCIFNPTEVGGSYPCFKADNLSVDATVTDCQFLASGGATVTAIALGVYAADSQFFESGNDFGTGITAYSYTAHKDCEGVVLLTRETRSTYVTDNVGNIPIPTDQYGVIVVSSTSAGPNVQGTTPPRGAKGKVLFYHPSGGAGTVTLTTGFLPSTLHVTADLHTYVFDYVTQTVTSTLRMLIYVDGFDIVGA